MKKIKMFVLGLILFLPLSVSALDLTGLKPAIEYPNIILQDYINTPFEQAEKIPKDYSFSPKINSNTEVETFGTIKSEDDKTYYFDLMQNTPGQFGIIYKNVGVYNGTVIDLKITVDSFTIQPLVTVPYRKLEVYKKSLSILTNGVTDLEVTFTFLKNNTNEEIVIKGYLSDSDIDVYQGVVFKKDEVQKIYISQNSKLFYKDFGDGTVIIVEDENYESDTGMFENGIGPNEKYMYTYTFNASKLYKNFYNGEPASNAGFGITGDPMVPIQMPKPVKESFNITLNSSNIKMSGLTDAIEHTITVNVPASMPTYYYQFMIVSDQILDIFDIESIKMIDVDDNKDATDLFDIQVNNNRIEASVKDISDPNFYNNIYQMKIVLKIKENADLSPYLVNGTYVFKNKASVETDKLNLDSNEVEVHYDDPTYVPPTPTPDNPNTGDGMILLFLGFMVVVSSIVILQIRRKQEFKNRV